MSKTVLITGGNRGLGLALVRCFAGCGTPGGDASHGTGNHETWNVMATARNIDSLPKDVNITPYPLDLHHSDDVDHLVNLLLSHNTVDHPIKIDLLIHNAGFNPKDVKDDEGNLFFASTFYAKHFSAHSVGECCKINALHPMELTGKLLSNNLLSDSCVVLGISSWLGSITDKNFAGHYGYAGSKALFNMCLKGLALEFQKDPDTSRCAIAINPGWMKTDMGGDNAEQTPEQVAKSIYDMVLDEGYLLGKNGKFLNVDRTEHAW